MEKNEIFDRYEITISGPDPFTDNKYWLRVKSLKARMGRTKNNFVSIFSTLEEAKKGSEKFKQSKSK